MTNYEFYKDRILEIAASALAVVDNEPQRCENTKCSDCLCGKDGYNCNTDEMFTWLKAEHKEPVKLSRFGYELLKKFKSIGFKWIARDENKVLVIYKEEPEKVGSHWWSSKGLQIAPMFDEFAIVKWEDTEPTRIDELLENCVIEEEK